MAFDALAWDLSCPDWEQRLVDGRSLLPDLPLNEAQADRGEQIFGMLRLPDVPNQPALAEACGPWFRDLVRAVTGSLVASSSLTQPVLQRMVREVFCLVPKKNSKTTNSAGLGLTLLLLNERPNAEMLIIGPTIDVARLCFNQLTGMIDADPEGYLSKRFHVAEHKLSVEDRVNGTKLRVKSFDKRVVTGTKPIVVIVDELHVMSSNSYAASVIGQLRGGLIANPEALLVFITTQSDTPPAGAFKAELEIARKVRDGEFVPGKQPCLPLLYEFPESIQRSDEKLWRNPALWGQVLPNAGYSITVERLHEDYLVAVEKGPEEEARWASQHLNVEIGMALHTARWIGVDFWPAAGGGAADLDDLIERCDVVTLGIDGGGRDDLVGLAVLGREPEAMPDDTDRWLSWGRAWAHSLVFERRKEIAPRLRDFEKDGDLVEIKTSADDAQEIAAIARKVMDAGKLPEIAGIGMDPMLVDQIVAELKAAGIPESCLVAVPQGTRLAPAVWGMERRLEDGSLLHADQPMMDWCVSNARAEQRGNAVLISKAVAGKAKIDPLIGLFNAAELMGRGPVAGGTNDIERGYLDV